VFNYSSELSDFSLDAFLASDLLLGSASLELSAATFYD